MNIGILRQNNSPNLLTYAGMDTFEPQVDVQSSAPITSYTDLISRLPGKKYSNIVPVISFTNAYTNICPGGVVTDPADATKFLMYVGRFVGNSRTNAIISVYRGTKANPFTSLVYVQDVLAKAGAGFDNNGVSFGSVLLDSGTIYLYYGAQNTSNIESIGVTTSTDGLTFTGRTQILAPDVTNETGITDPTVIKDGSTYYLYATRKTGTPGVNIIPVGILIASSSSPNTGFTKTGTIAVALGSDTDPDAKYIEGGQVIKLGSDYVLLYTENSSTDIWSVRAAFASSPNSAFTKGAIVLEHSSLGWDSESVAVPLLYNPSGDVWVMYYQGTTQQQPASIWSIGAVDISTKVTYSAGYISGKNGWSGDISQFDITYGFINGTRSLRALKNTSTVSVIKTQDVTPSSTSFFKGTMMSPDNTTAFLAGFLVMEGNNVITGVYFNAGNISYLKDSGWTTLQAYSKNIKYTVEIFLPTNSTHTIKVNGSTVVSNQANAVNIVTKADKIKIEKQTTSTSVVYFDDILCANQ